MQSEEKLIWNDCKIDPPDKEGEYILCFIEDKEKYWDKAFYDFNFKQWYNLEFLVPYGDPEWGWSKSVPYKWAEIKLPK